QAGLGVAATVTLPEVGYAQIYLGNLAWIEKNDCVAAQAAQDAATELGQAGKTAVYVSQKTNQGCQLIGIVGVADTLRPDAVETIKQLQKLGIAVQILSGDSQAAARAIAQQLGIDLAQVKAEMTPSQKVEAIASLQKAGDRVGLVGDGINDAPALAQANIGIALNSGTDVAMETADIVLMGDALADILAAIRLSRATFNKIRQNLGWAFAYNLVCIPLAAGAFLPAFGLSLNPGFAGGLMALSSVTVVLNSLMLRIQKI
ncbi:MAG: HAD-IC family P-type ATPase, partial [Phormidesmis sp.]